MKKVEASYGRRGQCRIDTPAPFSLVIFGASGDLTRRKIMPSVYRLFVNNLLPEDFAVIGAARREMGEAAFREAMCEAVKAGVGDAFTHASWEEFSGRLYYHRVDYQDTASCSTLKLKLSEIESRHATAGNRIFYLAVPPTVYAGTATGLGEAGLAAPYDGGYTHIVIEKPFGRDLGSARELNHALRAHFQESQIFRMDHYLAKETVQNLLMFRFANSIFEPLWNQKYIEHVEITVSETLGVEHRAGYYEEAGVIRDMFQNHIFQLLALTAMEPPSRMEADRVRDEKIKVFGSLRPFDLERLGDSVSLGQYGPGSGGSVPAYRDEKGVSRGSNTPTFCAMKVHVDNWRWNGVPFYLRSGKRLARRKAEISIHFRQAPHLMFQSDEGGEPEPNVLCMRLQPEEGISLTFQTKEPGTRLCLDPVLMDFKYAEVFALSAYERVLLDCMVGDQMLFVREDGVDAAWEILTPAIERLEADAAVGGIPLYESGGQGPGGSLDMLRRDGREWRPI
jgi:glucose-6-phosphate 1-dehydrogenase